MNAAHKKGKAPTAATAEALNEATPHIKEGFNMSNFTSMTIAGTAVRQANGLFSLNDLHRASGGEENFKPAFFLRNDQTKALIEELAKGADLHLFLKTTKGRNGSTYACRELVIAYAAWISAAFHLKVIRVFLAVAAPQPTPYTVQPSDTLNEPQQEIDVAALLLSGQCDPKPLTAAQHMLIDQCAGRLVGEAYPLIRAHLERRVAWNSNAAQQNSAEATQAILGGATLGNCLAHHYRNELQAAHTVMQVVRQRLDAALGSIIQPLGLSH